VGEEAFEHHGVLVTLRHGVPISAAGDLSTHARDLLPRFERLVERAEEG